MRTEPIAAFVLAWLLAVAGAMVGKAGEPTATTLILGIGLIGAGGGVVIWLVVSQLVRWIEWRWRRTRDLERRLAERLGLP